MGLKLHGAGLIPCTISGHVFENLMHKRLAAEKKPMWAQLFYYVNQPAGKSEPQRAQLFHLSLTKCGLS